MSHLASLSFVLWVLAGCGSGDARKPPPKYTGPLTFERFAEVKDGTVALRDDWKYAVAVIESHLGAPTQIRDGFAAWALDDGAWCASVMLEAKGDKVGSITRQPKIDKEGFTNPEDNNYTQCAKLAKK